MSEVTDIVVPMLHQLERQVASLGPRMDDLALDLAALTDALTRVETHIETCHASMDRIEACASRIERRLDLIEA